MLRGILAHIQSERKEGRCWIKFQYYSKWRVITFPSSHHWSSALPQCSIVCYLRTQHIRHICVQRMVHWYDMIWCVVAVSLYLSLFQFLLQRFQFESKWNGMSYCVCHRPYCIIANECVCVCCMRSRCKRKQVYLAKSKLNTCKNNSSRSDGRYGRKTIAWRCSYHIAFFWVYTICIPVIQGSSIQSSNAVFELEFARTAIWGSKVHSLNMHVSNHPSHGRLKRPKRCTVRLRCGAKRCDVRCYGDRWKCEITAG